MFWITALVLMFGVWQYRAQWHADLSGKSGPKIQGDGKDVT